MKFDRSQKHQFIAYYEHFFMQNDWTMNGIPVSGRWTARSAYLDCVKFHGSRSSRRLCGWPLASAVRVALR